MLGIEELAKASAPCHPLMPYRWVAKTWRIAGIAASRKTAQEKGGKKKRNKLKQQKKYVWGGEGLRGGKERTGE